MHGRYAGQADSRMWHVSLYMSSLYAAHHDNTYSSAGNRCLNFNLLFYLCKLVLISMVCLGPHTESHSVQSTLSRLVQICSKQGRVLAGEHVVSDTMQHSV